MEQPLVKSVPTHQNQQIERAKREWEVTVDTLPQLICLLDYQGCVLRANRTAERWHLAPVVSVKGRETHQFLHKACTDPNCYLIGFLEEAWLELEQGQSVEREFQDKILDRYLQIQLQPLSIHPLRSGEEHLTADSFAVLVLDDISKQKQAEAALHQYTRELKDRNEDLDAFGHTVAHNLKGLLLPVIGYAELLKNSNYQISPEVLQGDLERIAKNGHKMKQVIGELLLLASTHRTDIQLKPLTMSAIIAEVQHRLAYAIEESQAELILPEAWPLALGHASWIEEVWTNYLSNALKYGGQPPQIELGATVSPEIENSVRFWIRDNGAGLSPEQQSELFKPFVRLDQVKVDGAGLGLSIVRRIVEKMGGQVSVESEGVSGRGCTFSFTLPAA